MEETWDGAHIRRPRLAVHPPLKGAAAHISPADCCELVSVTFLSHFLSFAVHRREKTVRPCCILPRNGPFSGWRRSRPPWRCWGSLYDVASSRRSVIFLVLSGRRSLCSGSCIRSLPNTSSGIPSMHIRNGVRCAFWARAPWW